MKTESLYEICTGSLVFLRGFEVEYLLANILAFQLTLDLKLFGVPDEINSIIFLVSDIALMWVLHIIAQRYRILVKPRRKKRHPPKLYTLAPRKAPINVSEDPEWPMIEL